MIIPVEHAVAIDIIEDTPHDATRGIRNIGCLLYTSDAADERSSVDLGGRRIIKKKTFDETASINHIEK